MENVMYRLWTEYIISSDLNVAIFIVIIVVVGMFIKLIAFTCEQYCYNTLIWRLSNRFVFKRVYLINIMIGITYFIISYVFITALVHVIVYLLTNMINGKYLEIALLFSSFMCYHEGSLSNISILFNLSLWTTIQVYEIIKDKHEIDNDDTIDNDIYSWPIIAIFSAAMLGSAFHQKQNHLPPPPMTQNKSEKYEPKSEPQPQNINITNNNNGKNTKLEKEEPSIMMNAIHGLMGFVLSSVSWTTLYKMFKNPGTFIIGSILASISSQLGLYCMKEKLMIYHESISTQLTLYKEKSEMNWKYFYNELLPLILQKCWRYLCIFLGVYFGLLYVSTVITPYHITEHHFFVLSMQQNIAYIWYLIPGDINMREDLFLVIVLLPLIYYMIDTHPNPEQYLKLQLGCLCIAYFIARICDAINKKCRRKM